MAVAGMREHEVIDRGIGGDESGEKPRPRALLPQSTAQPPDRQHRRRQKSGTAEIPRGNAIRRSGHAVPVIKKTLQADDRKPPRMRADPLESQPPAVGL